MDLWRKAAMKPGDEFHPCWRLPLHPTGVGPRSKRTPGPSQGAEGICAIARCHAKTSRKAEWPWWYVGYLTSCHGIHLRPFTSVTGWVDAQSFRTSRLRRNSRDGSRVSQCCPSLLAHRPEWLRGGFHFSGFGEEIDCKWIGAINMPGIMVRNRQ